MDQRGQAISLTRVFLYFGVAAFVIGVLFNEAGMAIIQGSQAAADSSQGQQAALWSQQFVELLPLFVMLSGLLSVIIAAVFQRERIR
jgi:uncharacterized sodium:solute symporter family permease YidK